MTTNPPVLLVTCEHGGKRIPARYQQFFTGTEAILTSHRGWDAGALQLARRLAKAGSAQLEFETRSRLLIEINRTLGHPRIFSEFSRTFPADERQKLIDEIYLPYRQRVTDFIACESKKRPVLHLSIHSFTPVLNEKTRKTDFGLLFDPARESESRFAHAWRNSLRKFLPDLKIHFNLPYRGTSDGFTTALRKEFPDPKYAGIELEVNQKYPLGEASTWLETQQRLTKSLLDASNEF